MGFPVVNVTRSFNDQGSGEEVTFLQERFLLNENSDRDNDKYIHFYGL